jgi:hypothetical protein
VNLNEHSECGKKFEIRMSKPETNPKSEIRETPGRAGIRARNLAGGRPSKPRRGCLFIDGGESTLASFCFSAARPHRYGSYRNGMGHLVGAHRFHSAAAEKQKEDKKDAGAIYKQGTPTGLGPKRGRARLEIRLFEFQICFELRTSYFELLPS